MWALRRSSGAMVSVTSLVVWGLGSAAAAGPYRDKHGNEGVLTLGSPVVSSGGSSIDYSVPYTSNDSEGAKSGAYVVMSAMLPGRDAGSDDFVLSIFVVDDATQNAAQLVFRNNPNVAPLAPVLLLLDCSLDPCVVDKTYDDPEWGAWIIQGQSDIANYPIELLDARVISQLLEPAQLSQLPNPTDGTGNWAVIMENHRTNFEEARFRADVDHLGFAQSSLLTARMIAEIQSNIGVPGEDWLVKHFPDITHNALTFLTGHRALIEEMTTVLFDTHLDNWPLDFTFPFGRMPIWLVDPHHDATPATPCGPAPNCHELPPFWEQVIAGQAALGNPGCWHDFPLDAYVPTLGNGVTNLGQYECAQVVTPDGFVDRPCVQESDYSGPGTGGTSLRSDVEGAYHNPIHGFIGGSFGPAATTAGTMVFWVFHTHVSTNLLANWRHAQKRDMGTPNRTPVCNANGPHIAECQGTTTDFVLDGTGSSDPDGDAITYQWTTDCAGGVFDDDSSSGPTLTVDSLAFPLSCTATLTVTDDLGASAACDVSLTVEDTTPPDITVMLSEDVLWPANHRLRDIHATVVATDTCDAEPTIVLTSIASDEPVDGKGDGNTAPDIAGALVGTPDFDYQLRAERSARGDGRTYTVVYTATDDADNSMDASAGVDVPHDKRK